MKTLPFFLALFFLFHINLPKAELLPILNSNSRTYLLDTSSIKEKELKKEAVIVINFNQAQKLTNPPLNYKSTSNIYLFDCQQRKYRWITSSLYPEKDASGPLVSKIDFMEFGIKPSWTPFDEPFLKVEKIICLG
jgi:hypothetical protein